MAIFNSYVKLPEGIWRHKGLYGFCFWVPLLQWWADLGQNSRYIIWWSGASLCRFSMVDRWRRTLQALCLFSCHLDTTGGGLLFLSGLRFLLGSIWIPKKMPLAILAIKPTKNGKICVQDLWPTNHWAEQWISSLLLGWATEGGFSTLVSAFVIHSPSWIFLNFLSRAPQQADPQTVSSQEVIQFTWKVPSYALDRSNHFDPRWSNHYFFKIIFDN